MKKIRLNFAIVMGSLVVTLLSSCATVYNKIPIYLSNTNTTTVITENGKPVEIKDVVVTSSGDATQTTTYYHKGMLIPRSKTDRHLVVEHDGKKADLVLESKFATGTFIADFWLGFGVGLVVDLVSGPIRTYKVKYYDINDIVNNSESKK